MTAHLLIGPVLRRVVGDRATIWVETSAPTVVRVRADGGAGGEARTFTVFGHHYALVVVTGLAPDTCSGYRVWLDDRQVWPLPDSPYPPTVIRTRARDDADQPVRLVFGSCRETTQHATTRRLPPDALDAYARRLMDRPDDPACRPDLLVLLGDQVYADETSPKVRRFLRRRRRAAAADRPATQVVTYEEYTKLYLESWRDPEIRWLFATVPSVMIFDDHEIIDDWNSSAAWRADMAAQPWWRERIVSGLASYWVYQHIGNLSPDEIATDPVFAAVTAVEDGTAALREFAEGVDAGRAALRSQSPVYQWSYALDIGRTRLVMLDNRCSRVLDPQQRAMLPPEEWDWFLDRAHGEYDHLVVGFSLPWLMPPAIHHVEAWNEKTARSPRRWVAWPAEGIRRAFDLEHWAAFPRSFDALAELFRRIGTGPDGRTGPGSAGFPDSDGFPGGTRRRVGAGSAYPPPVSISVLSGDVHHSYVARAALGAEVVTPVHQLTCSPFHNQVPGLVRPLMRLSWADGSAAAARALARAAGLARPTVAWRRLVGPYFGNAVGTLLHDGRRAHVTIEGTTRDGDLRLVAAVPLNVGDPPAPAPRAAADDPTPAPPAPTPTA